MFSCAICGEKKGRLLTIDDKIIEKKLSEVIANISGEQALKLNSTREFLICVDCAVCLVQAENVVEKLRRALLANASAFEARMKDPEGKKILQLGALGPNQNGKQPDLLPSTLNSKRTWLFKCSHCSFETRTPKIFRRHRLVKHKLDNPRIYQCMFCSESYQRQNGIHNHIAHIHDNKPRSTPRRRNTIALEVANSSGVNLQIGTDTSMADSQDSDDCKTPHKTKLHKSAGVPVTGEALTTYHFKCEQCQYEVQNAKFFKKHLITKHKIENPRIYKCTQCTSSYKLLYALRNHVAFVHEQKPRPIPQRRKSVAPGFINDEPLDTNVQYESPVEESVPQDDNEMPTTCLNSPERLNCLYCSYSTDTAQHLCQHVSSKHYFDTTEKEEMDVSSDVLEENGEIKEEFIDMSPTQHNQEDLGMGVQLLVKSKSDWTFTCGYCPFETNKKKQYKAHLLASHKIDDECIYKCAFCSESFEQHTHLQNHIERVHQNTDSDHLDSSQLSTAEKDSKLCCRYTDCNKRFSKPSKLHQHMMKRHHDNVENEKDSIEFLSSKQTNQFRILIQKYN